MLAIAWYLLKVLLCSGILFGYYWIALRNKRFHLYNRFYLLISVALSWLIPLLKIDFSSTEEKQPQIITLLNVVSTGDDYVAQASPSTSFVFNWDLIALSAFYAVCAVFLLHLIVGLFRIWILISKNIKKRWNKIIFVFADVKGTPFSFFKYIFWNEKINLDTDEGQHILRHELAHVHEKHSADKLFIGLALTISWYNPFIWLMRKELFMIHEFIADEQAIKDGDTAAFASMILKAAYPSSTYPHTNPFFYSPLKRRLQMLTSSKNTRYSYLRRLAILPLLSFVTVFFAFKLKNKNVGSIHLEKKYSVVIDIGHGGKDAGARVDGISEKDITLQLGQLIKSLNTNDNIEVLLTRESDEYLSPQQRIAFIKNEQADLLISIHISTTAPNQEGGSTVASLRQGAEIFLPKNMMFDNDNRILAGIVSNNLQSIFEKEASIRRRQMAIHILDANTVCPSVLVECGVITNKKDFEILNDKKKQHAISRGILKSIEQYFYHTEKNTGKAQPNSVSMQDNKGNNKRSMPVESATSSVENITIVEGNITNAVVNIPLQKTTQEDIDTLIRVRMKNSSGGEYSFGTKPSSKESIRSRKELVVLDGRQMTWEDLGKIDMLSKKIKQVKVLKDAPAVEKYGEGGKNGVIEVTTLPSIHKTAMLPKAQDENPRNVDSIPKVSSNKIFTRVENPAAYNGNLLQYIKANLQYPSQAKNKNVEGKVLIRFIVDEDGNLSDFKPLTSIGFGLETEAIRLLRNSGPWKPAMQNGRKVVYEVKHEISFGMNGQQDVSQNTKAEFPGGIQAWKNYLEKNLNADVLAMNRAPSGNYSATIAFDVNKQGEISNLKAETKQGFGTEEESIRIIKSGPKWVPAKQDGRFVDSHVKQTITFMVTE